MAARFVIEDDNRGEWRWKFVASNGETIAVSSEGYKAKSDCAHGIDLIKNDGPGAPVEGKA